ncbi:MAG TPA: FG-GAP-like repeat-containing protein, partial [Acidimicrobiales bacterium]|nr:FG-GAP-like repeat-containing protein [Acidimicrobiales bacterium]
ANKVHLNRGELPVPCTAAAPCTTRYGGTLQDYDVNHDGVFNVQDYAHDPRVTDRNHNGILDPEDLILTFSDGKDHDHNGYVNDIAGWDFYQADNNPADDVTYGHGTGEARDSSAEIEKQLTQCPNCMIEPLRVGDSFIADINHWAQAVFYAVDNGASVIQEALGTINHTAFAQAAADYAYSHGVLVVASEADESAGHHNYPAALNHTMVVNSVTPGATAGDVPGAGQAFDPLPAQLQSAKGTPIQRPNTFLAFNGCTNFGGYTWVSIESSSCSSDATGQSSGMAGLLYSEARNAVQKGVIAPDASGRPLSAEEAKQLIRLAADDIDFSTPRCDPAPKCGPPNNFATTLPASQRFVTTAGWDQISGWGRLSSNKAVHLVADGKIPPEADITSPSWWQPLPASGRVDVVGRVAAPRATSYTYEVQFAPGVQPARFPFTERWTTVTTGSGTSPKTGVLTTLNLDQVRAAIKAAPPAYTPADDPTSRDLPEKDAFRVRVVVHAEGDTTTPWKTAIEQRQYFSSPDPALLGAFPKSLNADGASSPAFADIDGDGRNELIMADGNGFVHAFKNDGSEAKGFPVHTNRLNLSATQTGGHTVYGPVLLGSPTVADLDGDGWPEISAADTEGYLYVWEHDGQLRKGFPVQVNRAYSESSVCQSSSPMTPGCVHPVRDHVNTVDHAFTSNPSAGNLDPNYPGLEIVAGANDGHVYAWHADGTPVPGWPVLLRDPAKVASVDPVSHFVTFKPGANAQYGRQVITTPTLADINGDGIPEVISNVDEEYKEAPNVSAARNPIFAGVATLQGGNTRVYALYHDGTQHPGAPKVANLGDNAYVKGWPVPIAMLQTELLPDVGSGADAAPIVADVDGDGKPEIATASIGSPPYLLNADGTSKYGNGPDGKYLTTASEGAEFKNPTATDAPSVASLGGPAFGHLGGDGSPMSMAMGATGLRRLLDVVLPEQQLGAEDHVDAWNALTGTFDPGFPAQMNDLQFFNTPAIADINGDGKAEVLQSSAMYDMRAYGLGGVAPPGWPKFTGGWSVETPAVGDFEGNGKVDVALATREGNLFVWR